MIEKDNQNQILNQIECRLEQIEKLVTLSLIGDILPQYENDLYLRLSDEMKKIIEDKDFYIVKAEIFSDKVAVYIRTEKKVGIKEFRELKSLFIEYGENIILVFELDKATTIQKRKFVEEKISYYITGREVFISKD